MKERRKLRLLKHWRSESWTTSNQPQALSLRHLRLYVMLYSYMSKILTTSLVYEIYCSIPCSIAAP